MPSVIRLIIKGYHEYGTLSSEICPQPDITVLKAFHKSRKGFIPLKNLTFVLADKCEVFLGGGGGIPRLRASHGGCNVPPAHCQEPPFESL